MSLKIQKSIKLALKRLGINIVVKSDFDNYITNIDKNRDLWELLIQKSPSLKSVAPDCKKLRQLLNSYDTELINRIKEAENSTGIEIRLELSKLKQWILDVQNKLREIKKYNGLLIIWDEFTELMRSAVGLRLLNPLQEIAESLMSKDNDSYFLFITHPSAFNGLETEESTKTKGRFHYIHYNMDTVSAFKIMSRKFKTVNPKNNEYASLYKRFYADKQYMLEMFSRSSNSPDETKEDLMRVFPIHPYTANLATYYAREIGSSSRSVFQFMACEQVRDFLYSEAEFSKQNTITADMLWDYVKEDFENDSLRFAAVTERYNSYKVTAENAGNTVNAVFKGILLLNALNNIAQSSTVTPSEENIKGLFIGTAHSKNVEEAMNFLNEKSIIQKTPLGLFSIQFSTLPMGEIQEKKEELLKTEFKYTSQVIRYGTTAKDEFERMLKNMARPYTLEFYSENVNEHTLLNMVENGYKRSKSYDVFLALFFARNAQELNKIKIITEKASKEERFEHVAFVVFDTILGDREYERFIEYMSVAMVAQQHNLIEQNTAHTQDASDMISAWINNLKRGNLTYYIRGNSDIQNARNIPTIVNKYISPVIFSSGPESLALIQTKYSLSYWKKASVKSTVDTVLTFNTKDDIIERCSGAAKHVEFLLQDSVNDNLEFKSDIDKEHPLLKVSQKVKSIFDHTNKNTTFNLGDKLEELSKPPFGLFQSYAPMAMVAFAMRPYIKLIFDANGKPRDAQHLVDDVVEVFKSWEDKKTSPKLNYQFESKESGELCKKIIKTFNLDSLAGYNNISSLKDARWAITHEFATGKGYPLWALVYLDISDGIKTLIKNVQTICDPSGEAMKNPSFLGDTIHLLKQYQIDLKGIISDSGSFKNGFVNFIKSDEHVKLKDQEVDSAIDYLHKHLSGTVGLWLEREVVNAIKDWRISKNIESQSFRDALSSDGTNNIPPQVNSEPSMGLDEQRKHILNYLNDTSAELLKELLIKICKQGNETIIQIIESYVK